MNEELTAAELETLARLLVRFHNQTAAGIDADAPDFAIFGRRMDCELVRDCHDTLSRCLSLDVWAETAKGFKPCL
jgi:hypothetical protein